MDPIASTRPELNLDSGSLYDFTPYIGDDETDRVNHQLRQLTKMFKESDDIKALQEVLDRAKPVISTLYFLLDKIYDKRPRIAGEMLNFKQYSSEKLPEIAYEAFEREGDLEFLDKLVKLNIGDDLKATIINRALHKAVELHSTSGFGDSLLLDYLDLIETLLDAGADPLNKTEYIGTNTESQTPLAIASNKTPREKALIKLLTEALSDSDSD